MATRGIKIYFSLSIIFYLLIGFYAWYSVYTIRTDKINDAADAASFINADIDSAYSIDYTFSSDYFNSKMNEIFNRYPTLRGIILVSNERGAEYIKLTYAGLLQNPPAGVSDADWKPEIAYSSPLMKKIDTRIYFSDGSSAASILIFDLLDRSLFFPFLRNILIFVLCHLLLTVIILALQKQGLTSSAAEVRPGTADDFFTVNEPAPIESGIPSMPDEESPESPAEVPAVSGFYTERSGLVWEHFLAEKLDAELKRAASFDQDSCLTFISVVSPSGFIPYRNIAELIIEHFKYKDLAFESGDNTFCVIIPEKDIDEGLHEIEKFKKSLIARFPDSSYRVYAGVTSRNSRLLSEKRMIHEARAALSRAETEPESTTISFRTDLNKYREYIASNL